MFRRHTSHRADDGIHWDGVMHRSITNMLLWHVCHAWHVEMPTGKSLLGERPSLLGESPWRQPIPSLLQLNCMPSRSVVSEFGRRFHTLQPNRRPMMHVDFSTDELNANDFASFGCQRRQTGFGLYQNWNYMRQFGSDLTNNARRGRCDLRNYRHHPY